MGVRYNMTTSFGVNMDIAFSTYYVQCRSYTMGRVEKSNTHPRCETIVMCKMEERL